MSRLKTVMTCLTMGLTAISSTPLVADDFDPTEYIDAKAASSTGAEKNIKQSEVLINGRTFLRFKSDYGVILVPKVTYVSRQEFERALCSAGTQRPKCDPSKLKNQRPGPDGAVMPAECLSELEQGTTFLRVETPLAENLVAYADAIVMTTQKPCGPGEQPNPTLIGKPGVEVGIESKNTGRAPGGKKIFLRNREVTNPKADTYKSGVKPALGVGVSF